MRHLILSDIHANLHALDAALADASAIGYDNVLVLGDLVGYGADPAGVIARVFALSPLQMIRGNHDKVCAGIEPAWTFNDVARTSIEWTRRVLDAADLDRLRTLPAGPLTVAPGIEICHGAPFDEDHYIFDRDDIGRALAAASEPLCLFGHTHVPALYTPSTSPEWTEESARDGDVSYCAPEMARALINVGSIGQPRDGDARAAYGVLDTTTRRLTLRRVAYDIAGAQRRILDAGLPAWLAMRLERGQ